LNFFGHAIVAAWTDRSADHLLGSMLPDFEAMTRVPLVGVRDPAIQRGVDTHHRTDEVFHRARGFVSLSAWALGALTDAGVRRGTARAVGHIASEMFLDGHLVEQSSEVEGYLAALTMETAEVLDWEDGGDAFGVLRGRLHRWGAPKDYADPGFVLARLGDALRSRPALAIAEADEPRIAECLPELQKRVRKQAPELLDELQDALGCGT